eukprot:13942808-Alexandrium_andersonii.AAC.1
MSADLLASEAAHWPAASAPRALTAALQATAWALFAVMVFNLVSCSTWSSLVCWASTRASS